MSDLLDYADQAAFLALRALGRGPLVQATWILPGDVDPVELRRFDERLGHTLLGRRIERSSIPCGRHRWVRSSAPGDLLVAAGSIDPDELAAWRASLAARPLDPEFGPGRSLAVQRLTDGTTAMVLTVPHTLGDGMAITGAIRDAVIGRRTSLALPPSRDTVTWRDRVHDARVVLRSLPDAAKGVAAAVRLARASRVEAPGPFRTGALVDNAEGSAVIVTPSVFALIDEQAWEDRAHALGGRSSTLLAGLSVRLGELMGRLDELGRVVLDVPVSIRTADDDRANALTPMTLRVDPVGITSDLRKLRADFAEGVANVRAQGTSSIAVMALTPFVPRALARALEAPVNGGGVVDCAHLGQLDPEILRPLGTDAIALLLVGYEEISAQRLDQLGGVLKTGSTVLAGRVYVMVRAWQSGTVETRAQLVDLVSRALRDFSLSADLR